MLCFFFSGYTQNMYVINAGNFEANGTYSYTGSFNGFSRWEKNSFSIYYTYQIGCQPKWVIMNQDTMIYKNYQNNYYDSLPPSTEWQTTCYPGSIYPAPVVMSDYPVIYWNNLLWFTESIDNNGSISDQYKMQIVIKSIHQYTFNGASNEDFISVGKASAQYVPEGLTMKLIKKNDTLLELSFVGNALMHRASNSVYTISCTLHDSATTLFDSTSVINNNFSNIVIQFKQPELISSYMYFYESDADDGTVNNSYNRFIKINNFGYESFSGIEGENFYLTGKAIFSNLPQGFIPELILLNDTALQLKILDTALFHDYSNDCYDTQLNFTNNAFSGNNTDEIFGQPVRLYFDFFGVVGEQENIFNSNFDVYPNPAHTFIKVDSDKDKIIALEIYNQKGVLISSSDNACDNYLFDVSMLEKSLYFIKIISAKNVILKKIIIQ